MKPLSFKTLREASTKRLPQFKDAQGRICHRPDGSDWTPAQWLQAAIGELGEYANYRKKFERGDLTIEEFKFNAAMELADTITYLDLLAFRLGIDLGQAVENKFNYISARVNSTIRIENDTVIEKEIL